VATLIPARNGCLSRMTGGEKRFSERLEQKLEDDYLIWYDVPIGLKQRRPDFVVFHPHRGMLVLEVKDWKADTIAHAELAHGRRADEIAVLYRYNWQGERLRAAFEKVNLACNMASSDSGKRALFMIRDAVKLVSIHSSKGLEFPLVVIPWLGLLPKPGEEESHEARLLYVAMTRATERLLLTHHADSLFSRRIRESINEVQGQLAQA